MNVADLTTYLGLTKDVLLSITAVVGTVVAVRGLRTWNRQLKGGTEYELTRRILKCTYRLREAIRVVRNPFMSAAEMPPPANDDRAKMSREESLHHGSVHGYQRRWDPVVTARTDLQTELLEAEVLWGKDIHAKFEPLFALQHELFSYIQTYLRATDPTQPEHTQEKLHQLLSKRREALYDFSTSEEDQFTKDMSTSIARIESFLKPHLRK